MQACKKNKKYKLIYKGAGFISIIQIYIARSFQAVIDHFSKEESIPKSDGYNRFLNHFSFLFFSKWLVIYFVTRTVTGLS